VDADAATTTTAGNACALSVGSGTLDLSAGRTRPVHEGVTEVALDLTDIATDVQDDQEDAIQRSSDRDEDQIEMDKRVAAIVQEWEAAGKPAHGKGNPFRRISVPKDQRSDVKKIIRRATVLAKVDPAWWKDSKPNDAGRVTIKFGVQARKPKVEANGTDTPAATTSTPPADTAPATDTPPATDPNADQGGEQPQAAPTPGGLFGRNKK
jgi:hypothetical protein